MAFNPGYIPFIILLTVVVIGLWDVMKNYESNGCEMTWMFEYPEYLKINLKRSVAAKFPHYSLYVYGEGNYAESLQREQYNGVPVLFVPGNSGSYKQVRSLGSVALRKSESLKNNLHFNYFSVDLNEDFSALYGPVLNQQTEFVAACIKHILRLYKQSKNSPTSVVLVGHSMGGLISRGLYMLDGFDASSVTTIITQATPHDHPVYSFDKYLADYYDKVNGYWRENAKSKLSHVTVISTGGGFRDIQVPTLFTQLDNVVPVNRRVNSMTMSVPNAWVSTDHLCIVWCKQFVLATSRAMFDLIDGKTRQISTDDDYRIQVFKHHFISNSGHKSYKQRQQANSLVKLDGKGEKVLKLEQQWSLIGNKAVTQTYYFIPVALKDTHRLTIISSADSANWVMGCKEDDYKKCKEVVNLSNKGSIIPPNRSTPRKMIHISAEDVKDFSYIVLDQPFSYDKVEFIVDRYAIVDRQFNITVPGLVYSFFTKPLRFWVNSDPVITSTLEGAAYYNISVDGLETIRLAYIARLVPILCTDTHSGGGIMSYLEPWSQISTFSPCNESSKTTSKLSLKLQSKQPEGALSQLHLILNPSCKYKLQLDLSWKEMFGQFCRYHLYLFPSFLLSSLMLILAWQFKTTENRISLPLMKSFVEAINPPNIFPFVMPITGLTGFATVSKFVYGLGVPVMDRVVLEAIGLWNFGNIPNFYTAIGIPGMILVKIFVCSTTVLGKILRPLIRIIGSTTCVIISWCYCVLLMGLVLVAVKYSAAIALSVFFVFHFIKVSALSTREGDDDRRIYRINTVLLMIVFMLFIFIIPSLMTMNRYEWKELSIDTLACTGTTVLVSMLILTFVEDADSYCYTGWLKTLPSKLVLFCGAVTVLYGMYSVYRLPWFIEGVFIIVPVTEIMRRATGMVTQTKQKES